MTDCKHRTHPLLSRKLGPAHEDNHHINETLKRLHGVGLVPYTLTPAELFAKFYGCTLEAAEAATASWAHNMPQTDEWNGGRELKELQRQLQWAEQSLKHYKEDADKLRVQLDALANARSA